MTPMTDRPAAPDQQLSTASDPGHVGWSLVGPCRQSELDLLRRPGEGQVSGAGDLQMLDRGWNQCYALSSRCRGHAIYAAYNAVHISRRRRQVPAAARAQPVAAQARCDKRL